MNKNKKQKVYVLTTGGTIEKSYSESDGVLENRDSLLKRKLLMRLRLPYTDVQVSEIMAKDSLYMKDRDRKKIWLSIQKKFSRQCPILVLHGTDTMALTANFCFEQNPLPPVPVVFTGAMRPAGFDDSDALQNFIEALMATQIITPGYYISFHGHLFKVPRVRKNLRKKTFEAF